jgi:hypothetical protein
MTSYKMCVILKAGPETFQSSRIKVLNVINEEIKDEDSVILNPGINVFRSITNADACSFVCQIVSDKFVLVYFEPDVPGHDLLIKSLISNHHFDGKWGS